MVSGVSINNGVTTEQDVLRRLRVWIAALAIMCLGVGACLGALLAGRPVVAQNETQSIQQIARAPEALSASFAEIARRVEPAVVNIETVTAMPTAARDDDENDAEKKPGATPDKPNAKPQDGEGKPDKQGEEDGDEEESNPLLDMLRRQMQQVPRGVGSGFIIDPSGLILTNHHVVEGATTINVKLQSGELYRGRIVGTDADTDLAVVKITASRSLPTLKLGDSNQMEVGDWVLAIGSPFGLEQTVTAGIVSTKDRIPDNDSSSGLVRYIQTDAAINRGNSGGPLVNMRGEVIGINSQIATTTGDYNGIGFALPSTDAAFVYNQLAGAEKRVRRGYLGLQLQPVRGELGRVYGINDLRGAIVVDVPDTSAPAPKAGIETGDIITDFNNQSVRDSQDLIAKVASTPVGSTVRLSYLRESSAAPGAKLEKRTANVILGERPANVARGRRGLAEENETTDSKSNTSAKLDDARPKLDISLQELTPEIASEKKLGNLRGLFVKDVKEGGLGDAGRLAPGMVIQRVNRQQVTTMTDFKRIIDSLKSGDAIVMHVAFSDPRSERIIHNVLQFTFQ